MSSSAVPLRAGHADQIRATLRRSRRLVKRPKRNLDKKPKFLTWSISAQPAPYLNLFRDNEVYRTQQIYDFGTVLTSSNVGPVFGGQNFQFSQLPQSASWTGVFDQYMIESIEVWLQVNQTNNGGHTGWLYSAVDYDSGAAPATLVAMQSYQNAKQTSFITGHYHAFKPHIAVAAYQGAFSGYANKPSGWIDSNSPNVQHYGLVFGVSTTTDNGITFNLQMRQHLAFRNVI